MRPFLLAASHGFVGPSAAFFYNNNTNNVGCVSFINRAENRSRFSYPFRPFSALRNANSALNIMFHAVSRVFPEKRKNKGMGGQK
jgi:hypothetical protein